MEVRDLGEEDGDFGKDEMKRNLDGTTMRERNTSQVILPQLQLEAVLFRCRGIKNPGSDYLTFVETPD